MFWLIKNPLLIVLVNTTRMKHLKIRWLHYEVSHPLFFSCIVTWYGSRQTKMWALQDCLALKKQTLRFFNASAECHISWCLVLQQHRCKRLIVACDCINSVVYYSVYWPRWRTQEFCSGGFNKFSLGQRTENGGSGGGSPLVSGSGDSCTLVQEILSHIVKVS